MRLAHQLWRSLFLTDHSMLGLMTRNPTHTLSRQSAGRYSRHGPQHLPSSIRALTGIVCLALLPLCAVKDPLWAQQNAEGRWGDFQDNWRHHWNERKLDNRSTRYEVVIEDGERVLRASSDRSASALFHALEVRVTGTGRISWRWKVEGTLPNNQREREKAGDDYAARLFVIFGEATLGPETEAICYVWAANEPVGSVYENPYISTVATVVVETGNEHAGEWVAEERDFVEDFRSIFGKEPGVLSAVAIMVDTDDTGMSTTTYFDEIRIGTGESTR